MNINFENEKCEKRVIADGALAEKYKMNVGDCIHFWCNRKCDREGNCDDCISCHCGSCAYFDKYNKNYKDCKNFSYEDIKKYPFWFDCGICINMKCTQCLSCDKGPDCENFDCNHCVNFKAV